MPSGQAGATRSGTASSVLQPGLGLDLLPWDVLAGVGQGFAGGLRVGEVFVQLGGVVNRDDRGEPPPVLGDVDNLAAGGFVCSGGKVRRVFERKLAHDVLPRGGGQAGWPTDVATPSGYALPSQ